MSSYVAFAILCLIVFGSVSLILRLEKNGYRGPWPSTDRGKDGARPVRRLNAGRLRSQDELDAMLAECAAELKSIGVPISESVCPSVVLTRSHANFGDCCAWGGKENKTEYDYVIRLSRYTLSNTDRSLRNTIVHELLHTVPGAQNHRQVWKKWAAFASERLGYHISRQGLDDDTAADLENLRWGVIVQGKNRKTERQARPASRKA